LNDLLISGKSGTMLSMIASSSTGQLCHDGSCGGVFGESYASLGAVANVIPVDVAIPGCPPTPTALLQGILAAIGKRTKEP
jgi:Ni,Fe-hydrogenase III small subunit